MVCVDRIDEIDSSRLRAQRRKQSITPSRGILERSRDDLGTHAEIRGDRTAEDCCGNKMRQREVIHRRES